MTQPSAPSAAPPLPTGRSRPPATQRELAFKFRGGAPCLLFVETLGEWTGRRYERIATPALWKSWLRKMQWPVPEAPATAEQLACMRALRAAIHGVADTARQGLPPPPGAVDAINEAAMQVLPLRLLDRSGARTTEPQGVSHEAVLALLARDAIAVFAGPLRERIKQCASATCPVLFVDQSRRADRVWCSSTCGARLATARYRRKLLTDLVAEANAQQNDAGARQPVRSPGD